MTGSMSNMRYLLNIFYVTWTHFHVFIVGDDLGSESIIADDGFVLDAGEDDATLPAGRARTCRCDNAGAGRRHRHRRTATRAAAARAVDHQTISHHATRTTVYLLAQSRYNDRYTRRATEIYGSRHTMQKYLLSL